MANRLILVRHASPGADFAGRFIGSSDPPLDTAGRLQARESGLGCHAICPGPLLLQPA